MYFFTDLDNTLIYSHRCVACEERRWIETLNGKQQAYMIKDTYAYLLQATWLSMIPITTRTQRQYARLSFLASELRCSHALVDNGAILLIDDRVDTLWLADTKRLVRDELWEVRRLSNMLRSCILTHTIHEELFFTYVKCGDDRTLYEHLMKAADHTLVTMIQDRGKLYCMPKTLTKGNAIRRYLARFGASKSVIAGDSEFDITMLEEGDIALVAPALEQVVHHPQKMVMMGDPIISDQICKTLDKLHKKGCFDD